MYAAWGVDFLKYDLCSMQDEMRKLKNERPQEPDAPQADGRCLPQDGRCAEVHRPPHGVQPLPVRG